MIIENIVRTRSTNYKILPPLLLCAIAIVLSFFAVFNTNIAIIFVWLCLWILILTIFLNKFLISKDIKLLLPFIVIGLSIRLIMAFLFRIKSASTGGLITPDEFYYFDYAKDIAEAWKSGTFMGLLDINHYVGTRNFGYHVWSALHFLILPEKLLPVISNIFLDIIAGIIIFRLLKDETNLKIGKIGFIFWSINPIPIFWAVFNLKDTLLTTIIVSMVFCFYQIIKQPRKLMYIFMWVFLSIFLMTLRFYISFLLVLLFPFLFIFSSRIKIINRIFIVTFILLLTTFFWYKFPLSNKTTSWILSEGVHNIIMEQYNKSVTKSLHSSYSFNVSNIGTKSFLSTSIGFLLYPSPLNLKYIFGFTGRLSGIFFLIGTFLWYILLGYSFIGVVYVVKNQQKIYYFSILFPLATIIIYGFLPTEVEPRHRLMIMPFIIILAVIGFFKKVPHKKLLVMLSFVLITLMGILIE